MSGVAVALRFLFAQAVALRGNVILPLTAIGTF